MHRVSIIIYLIISVLTGCSQDFDSTLLEVNELINTDPKIALERLDSIDYAHLSPHDRHFFDFLNIKANDKAYHLHTSDSLILDVINYFDKKGTKEQYAEALYYGGRVYKDLGDYPNAIYYFQSSLDELPSDADLNLKANILSQTGRLFNELRLTDEATFYLEQVIEIDKQLNDTINLVYDLQLLGSININSSNYSIAEKFLKEALTLSKNLSPHHLAKTKMYLAEIKHCTGRIDSALIYIQNVVNNVKSSSQNMVLAYAAPIYKEAGLYDSAYIFAKQLIGSPDSNNKSFGYEILLSPELKHLSTPTEISNYIEDYRRTIELIFDDNKNQLAIEQITRHNYESQQQLRIKAERSETRFRYISFGAALVIVALTIFILFLLNQRKKNKRRLLTLNNALSNNISTINNLKRQLDNNQSDIATQIESENCEDLRNRILLLCETNPNDIPPLPDSFIHSEVYHSILSHLRRGKPINDNDEIWEKLKNLIDSTFPSFKPSLVKLSAGKLTEEDLRTSLLIKIGIKTSDIAKLFSKSKNSIISRRHSLSIKMFGKKIGTQATDIISKLL